MEIGNGIGIGSGNGNQGVLWQWHMACNRNVSVMMMEYPIPRWCHRDCSAVWRPMAITRSEK